MNKKQRTVLVILSNRFNKKVKPRWIEIECKPDGTILSEKSLRSEPKESKYDEVWTNDEGKTSVDTCRKMSRAYGHALQRPAKG